MKLAIKSQCVMISYLKPSSKYFRTVAYHIISSTLCLLVKSFVKPNGKLFVKIKKYKRYGINESTETVECEKLWCKHPALCLNSFLLSLLSYALTAHSTLLDSKLFPRAFLFTV